MEEKQATLVEVSSTEGSQPLGKPRANWSGQLGFVIAAAASAVGLGNIWRFPYLAAKDGGGIFILVYIILVLTFGFTLLTIEVALGRKTGQGPLTAYGKLSKKWKFLGVIACLVPAIILPYYCAIGGWVFKYFETYIFGQGALAAADGFFTGFITSNGEPVAWCICFLALSSIIIYLGVDKGIERLSKILLPALLVMIIGISVFSLFLSYTDPATGITRTGLDGVAVYLIPNFDGMTLQSFLVVVADAVGQLFFSISVCMGIMVAYGSYARKDTNMMSSINRIEIFDTAAALLAGLMIVPAVFVFMGAEGMSAGPGLIFISLPKIFESMGAAGTIIGTVFFVLVAFAALTSNISIMEAVVSSLMDRFGLSRRRATTFTSLWALVMGVIVCLGYNLLYFEVTLPNGSVGQILDIMDYISNSVLMPALGLLTCIFIGWIAGPKSIMDEVSRNGEKFQRKHLFIACVKFICPILLFVLLLQGLGLFSL